MKSDITWGDTVQVTQNAPSEYRAGQLGAVCGFWEIDNPNAEQRFKVPRGTMLYIVEFGDGNSVQVPETFLVKIAEG